MNPGWERPRASSLATLDRWSRVTVADDMVHLAQKHLRMDWFLTTEDMDRLAFEIGRLQTMDRWTTLTPYLAARDAATAADLRRIAHRYFIPENRTVGLVRAPEGARRDVS